MAPDLDVLLFRFVSGQASGAERERVEAWAHGDPQRQGTLAGLAAVWRASAPAPNDRLTQQEKEADWERVAGRLCRPGPPAEQRSHGRRTGTAAASATRTGES